MATPPFMAPSLSELMAPGQQRLGEIQNDANNFSGQVAQVPGLFDRYEAAKGKAEESARNARPVTPWEKAAARLLAGHDPKAVAADIKAQLAGGAPATPTGGAPGVGGVSAPGPGGAAPSAPTGVGNTTMQPTAQAGAAPGEDIFQGMTHRDWNDYIGAMEKGHAAALQRAQRDYIGEIRAKGEEERKNTGLKNEGAATVAKINASSRERAVELQNLVKQKFLDEKTANDLAKIDLGYDKLDANVRHWEEVKGSNEEIKFLHELLAHEDRVGHDKALVMATIPGLAAVHANGITEELDKREQAVKPFVEAARARLKVLEAKGLTPDMSGSSGESMRAPIAPPYGGAGREALRGMGPNKGKAPAPTPKPAPPPETPDIPDRNAIDPNKKTFPKQIKVNGKILTVKGISYEGKYVTD